MSLVETEKVTDFIQSYFKNQLEKDDKDMFSIVDYSAELCKGIEKLAEESEAL